MLATVTGRIQDISADVCPREFIIQSLSTPKFLPLDAAPDPDIPCRVVVHTQKTICTNSEGNFTFQVEGGRYRIIVPNHLWQRTVFIIEVPDDGGTYCITDVFSGAPDTPAALPYFDCLIMRNQTNGLLYRICLENIDGYATFTGFEAPIT
jgi:hypothetical protein